MADYYRALIPYESRACQAPDQGGPTPEQITAA
jgi:hypothetical protein